MKKESSLKGGKKVKDIKTGSKELIKEINRYKVLNIIRKKQPINRVEISKACNLGTSTLSYIIDELTNQQLIKEVGESSSTGGRRAKLYEFNEDFGLVVSVKIEEEQIILAITDMNADVIDLKKVGFERKSSPNIVVNLIIDGILKLVEKNQREYSQIRGIGILSSGLINRQKGVILRSSMLGWKNVHIAEMVQKNFHDIPVFVDKNINGYTLAELWKGEGKESKDFLVVSIGAGLGLSIVKDYKIYYGFVGGAGEFGHTTIVVDGYRCHCGQQGCLEMYASEFYFQNKGKELLSQYPNSSLKSFYFHEVAQQAMKGDELANRLIKEMSTYLGIGIRNLINTFNPEKVILAGEGMNDSQLFIKHVKEIAYDNFFSRADVSTKLLESKLNDSAWLMGGALLVINHIFQAPIYEEVKE
ncbi:ROK family transcriptional regulator [Fervidibacillus albus]|uniref:ROK family protein n=1 Tax=Fervidibacillus albus TaxID=2980026 RepID=A0A9E8LSR5_9BACI|nr:ROK family protein [Fervidibacillus albus]WAA08922.1 ROK family protein [Fervidibacillus albus]